MRVPRTADADAAAALPLAPPLRLPNLRAATTKQQQLFTERLDEQLSASARELQLLADSEHPAALTELASHLTALAHASAAATLPITGAAAYSNRCILQLQRQRQALSRLLRASCSLLRDPARAHSCEQLTCSPEWLRLFRRCTRHHGLRWRIDVQSCGDAQAWLAETRRLLRAARTAITHEHRRMLRAPVVPADANSAALVHRMLQSDALPSQLHSVVNADGELTASGDELKAVMAEHFRSVFAVPPGPAAALPQPTPAMLLDKESVQQEWYDGLMADVAEAELMQVAHLAPPVSAPGEDEVSSCYV